MAFHSEPPDHYDSSTCSRCHACSQAGLCHTNSDVRTRLVVFLRALRYSLGGRPSQTTHQTLSATRLRVNVRTSNTRVRRLHADWRPRPLSLSWPHQGSMVQCQAIKLTGVFSVLPRVHCIFTASSLSLGWRQPAIITFVGRTQPDRISPLLGPREATGRRFISLIKSFACANPINSTFRHRAGVTPYTSTFVGCNSAR